MQPDPNDQDGPRTVGPNVHLATRIVAAVNDHFGQKRDGLTPATRTELDSHANMCVVGKEALVV